MLEHCVSLLLLWNWMSQPLCYLGVQEVLDSGRPRNFARPINFLLLCVCGCGCVRACVQHFNSRCFLWVCPKGQEVWHKAAFHPPCFFRYFFHIHSLFLILLTINVIFLLPLPSYLLAFFLTIFLIQCLVPLNFYFNQITDCLSGTC